MWRRGRTDLDPQGPGVFRSLKRGLEHPPSSDVGGAASPSLAAVGTSQALNKEDEEEEMRAAYSSPSVYICVKATGEQ